MKIRSKELWQWLLDSGALQSRDEALIQKSKHAYRKAYKSDWERKHRNSKELRIRFSFNEMDTITKRSRLFNLNSASYAKEMILTSHEDRELVPRREEVMGILKTVSIAHNILLQEPGNEKVKSLLLKAEQELHKYLALKAEL